MVSTLNFYMDDSGIRYPNRKPGKKAGHGYDWFALGGVLINDEDEAAARELHAAFVAKGKVPAPLHSSEVRSQNESFFWLRDLSEESRASFYEDLYGLMRDAPVIGIACVIDRTGYNRRYMEMYLKEPWVLCKTAFSVAVERAAKFARQHNRRLRVFPERCNKQENRYLEGYYADLKTNGMPFAGGGDNKYAPLTAEEFTETLYEYKLKAKTSPLSQLADLYLWPICMGGYHLSNRTYARLVDDGKLIEARIPGEARTALGSKYSCFEGVQQKP